jgi:hypothetical protein
MNNYILFGVVLVIAALMIGISMNKAPFVNYIAYYAPKSQREWWRQPGWERFGYPSYTYWQNSVESFENLNDRPDSVAGSSKVNPILEYPPQTPGPADLYNNQPYHLLADQMGEPRVQESISCVNSRSCYATSFDRMVEKTGNYRQLTNNYKRGYPDSCSAPYQELVLNFYKTDGMPVPPNNTGGSVSEVSQ